MKKLFTNDKFFLAVVLCAVISSLLCILLNSFAVGFDLTYCGSVLITTICMAVLYSTYKKHSKNVMKGMMGALLMNVLLSAISSDSFSGGMETVISIVDLILVTALFVNHFIINSNHHSNSKHITINQIILIILAIFDAVRTINMMKIYPGILTGILLVLDIIGYIGMAAVVVCVESRLDAYRLDREKAGWTEEKGYPENYVHQYEKK